MKKLGIDGVLMIVGTIIFILSICLNNSFLFLVGVAWICALVFAECCCAVVQVFKDDSGDSDTSDDSDYYTEDYITPQNPETDYYYEDSDITGDSDTSNDSDITNDSDSDITNDSDSDITNDSNSDSEPEDKPVSKNILARIFEGSINVDEIL